MNKKMVIALFLFCLFSLSALAAMPKTLNYQGKLLDFTTKVPITTAIKTTFLIYEDATTGSVIWQEEQIITPDANGVFSAVLGNTTPVNVDLSKQLWLSVQAPTGPANALWPRRQLTATPYALYAVTAESVVSNSPAGGWVDDGTVVRLATITDKVGIGTTTPSETLEVNGNIKISGQIKGATPSYFIQEYTTSKNAIGIGWQDYGSTSITITGEVNDIFMIKLNTKVIPGNTGYNHERFAAVSGVTIIDDGQSAGYNTGIIENLCMIGLVRLTATTGIVKLQHYNSGPSDTHTMWGGPGGDAAAPIRIVAWKLH